MNEFNGIKKAVYDAIELAGEPLCMHQLAIKTNLSEAQVSGAATELARRGIFVKLFMKSTCKQQNRAHTFYNIGKKPKLVETVKPATPATPSEQKAEVVHVVKPAVKRAGIIMPSFSSVTIRITADGIEVKASK